MLCTSANSGALNAIRLEILTLNLTVMVMSMSELRQDLIMLYMEKPLTSFDLISAVIIMVSVATFGGVISCLSEFLRCFLPSVQDLALVLIYHYFFRSIRYSRSYCFYSLVICLVYSGSKVSLTCICSIYFLTSSQPLYWNLFI